jgi:hypothetical protein
MSTIELKPHKKEHVSFDPVVHVVSEKPHHRNIFYTKRDEKTMRDINRDSLIANLKRRYKRLLSEIYARRVVSDIMTRLRADVEESYKNQSQKTHALRQNEARRFLYQYLIDKDEDRLFRHKHSKYYKYTTRKKTK